MSFHKNFFVSFLLLIIYSSSYSQNKIEARATVDKNSILIGEPIQFTIQLSIPSGQSSRFFEIDSILHFEFLEKGKIDTIRSGNNTILKQISRITSFDSGRWVIPVFVLPGNKKVKTDSIPMDVRYSPFDRNKDYNDIKEIIEKEGEERRTPWHWYALAAAVILGVVIYLATRKKPRVKSQIQPDVDPYKEAMQQLHQLQGENLPAKGEIKKHYSRLIDIFRVYVLKKKQLQSLQKTTDDLVIQLQTIHLPQEQYNQLAQALRLGDFVKFAKYIPSADDNKTSYAAIKNSIDLIEKKSNA